MAITVDAMAERYGKLPSEVLRDASTVDFLAFVKLFVFFSSALIPLELDLPVLFLAFGCDFFGFPESLFFFASASSASI